MEKLSLVELKNVKTAYEPLGIPKSRIRIMEQAVEKIYVKNVLTVSEALKYLVNEVATNFNEQLYGSYMLAMRMYGHIPFVVDIDLN